MHRSLAALLASLAASGGLIATALTTQAVAKTSKKHCKSLTIQGAPANTHFKVKVKVTRGKLGCAAARTVIRDYYGGGVPTMVGGKQVITTSGGYACVVPSPVTRPVVCKKGGVTVTGTR